MTAVSIESLHNETVVAIGEFKRESGEKITALKEAADKYAEEFKTITAGRVAELAAELKETKNICGEIQDVCGKTLENCDRALEVCGGTQELYKEFCQKSDKNITLMTDSINSEIEELCGSIREQNHDDLKRINEALKTVPENIDSLREICETTLKKSAEKIDSAYDAFYGCYEDNIAEVKEELTAAAKNMSDSVNTSMSTDFPRQIRELFAALSDDLNKNNKKINGIMQDSITKMSAEIKGMSDTNKGYVTSIKNALDKESKLNDESIRIMRSILSSESPAAKKDVKRR
ncbi:MAG: hypothetical protein LUD81_08365 [Clostridiales bacterium]|nr:hypothetical protein [Clostridiales bacterium]